MPHTLFYLTHYDTNPFPFLQTEMAEKGCELQILHNPTDHGEYVNALIGAWRAVRKAKKDDVIVTYMSSGGVLVFWLSVLLRRSVKVVATNLSWKDDGSLQSKLMRFLYSRALRSARFVATVTSVAYGRSMQKAMNCTRSFPLLRDYGQYPGYAHAYHDNGKRIFCGGNSQRDWKACLLLAEALPDWQFVLVGMRGEPPVAVPANVRVLSAVPFNRFMHILCGSTIVYVPVKWNCPAGLIVLMEAAWQGKVLAANNNDVLSEYLGDGRGLLSDDVSVLAKDIERVYADEKKCGQMVEKMQQFLTSECSAKKYAGTICHVIETCF